MKMNRSLHYRPNISFYLSRTKQWCNQRTEHTLKNECNNTCMKTHSHTKEVPYNIYTILSWHQEDNSLTSTWEDHYTESSALLHAYFMVNCILE